MFTTSGITILLITRQGLLRGDVSGGRNAVLKGVWTQPRPDLPDLPALVEAALHMGPRPARRVYVLTTDLWTQTLDLPLHKSSNMGKAELAQALNFEAEALSGSSAFECVVGFVPQGVHEGFRSYWLIQARSADIDLIGDMVNRAGSKLMGVGHPGGLVRQPLAPADRTRSWQRIELWPDAVVALRGWPKGAVDVQVFSSDPQLGRWRADVADWEKKHEPADHKEVLAGPGITAPASTGELDPIRLDDERAAASWLVACSRQLGHARPEVPLLAPTPIPLSTGQRRGIAATAGLAALGVCLAVQFLWLDRGIKAANAERVQLQEPEGRFKKLEDQLKTLTAQGTKLKEEAAKFQHCAAKLVAQRKRLARLLTSLAGHHAEDLLVQKIDNETGEPRIRGVCLQPELADEFASWLARELRPAGQHQDGWEVQTPRKTARNLVAGGGPWDFEITCKIPVDPADVKTSAAPVIPRRR